MAQVSVVTSVGADTVTLAQRARPERRTMCVMSVALRLLISVRCVW